MGTFSRLMDKTKSKIASTIAPTPDPLGSVGGDRPGPVAGGQNVAGGAFQKPTDPLAPPPGPDTGGAAAAVGKKSFLTPPVPTMGEGDIEAAGMGPGVTQKPAPISEELADVRSGVSAGDIAGSMWTEFTTAVMGGDANLAGLASNDPMGAWKQFAEGKGFQVGDNGMVQGMYDSESGEWVPFEDEAPDTFETPGYESGIDFGGLAKDSIEGRESPLFKDLMDTGTQNLLDRLKGNAPEIDIQQTQGRERLTKLYAEEKARLGLIANHSGWKDSGRALSMRLNLTREQGARMAKFEADMAFLRATDKKQAFSDFKGWIGDEENRDLAKKYFGIDSEKMNFEQFTYNNKNKQWDVTYNERVRQYNEQFGFSQKQYDEGVRQFEKNFGLSTKKFFEGVRQFDLGRKDRLDEVEFNQMAALFPNMSESMKNLSMRSFLGDFAQQAYDADGNLLPDYQDPSEFTKFISEFAETSDPSLLNPDGTLNEKGLGLARELYTAPQNALLLQLRTVETDELMESIYGMEDRSEAMSAITGGVASIYKNDPAYVDQNGKLTDKGQMVANGMNRKYKNDLPDAQELIGTPEGKKNLFNSVMTGNASADEIDVFTNNLIAERDWDSIQKVLKGDNEKASKALSDAIPNFEPGGHRTSNGIMSDDWFAFDNPPAKGDIIMWKGKPAKVASDPYMVGGITVFDHEEIKLIGLDGKKFIVKP